MPSTLTNHAARGAVCTLFACSGMYVVAMAGLTVEVLVILVIVFFVMRRA